MREIKFRGWNKQSHMMVDDIEVMNGRNGTVAISEFFDPDMVVLPLQYTGLKDKNGVEIYDGDRLTNQSDGPLTVYWDEKYACWAARDTEDGTEYGLLGNCEPQNYEVTGNIYEDR